MADWRTLNVNVDGLTPGEFYRVYTDFNGTTLMIPKDGEDELAQKVNDNVARINNLEDNDLKTKFMQGMALSSIRKEFVDSTYIEVDYGRNEIHNVTVFKRITDDDNERIYEEMTAGVEVRFHEKYNNGVLYEKQVIIEMNQPTSGYVLVL